MIMTRTCKFPSIFSVDLSGPQTGSPLSSTYLNQPGSLRRRAAMYSGCTDPEVSVSDGTVELELRFRMQILQRERREWYQWMDSESDGRGGETAVRNS
jgi:hypothetical protein